MTRIRHPRRFGRARWPTLIFLLVILLAASGCSTYQLRDFDNQAEQCLSNLVAAAPVTGVFVAPDDREKPIIDEIAAAGCTIDVSVYLLTADTVIAALDAASDRGVRVRVMLEEHPFGGGGTQQETRQILESHGIEVKWSGSEFRFSHAKFMVIDGQVGIIMNQNLTASAFNGNREFGVITTDVDAVRQAQAIFDLDWSGDGSGNPDGPLIVSPVDSRDRYLDIIDEARRSIDFYAEVVRDDDIIAALVRAEQRGVAVRLIVDVSIDEPSWEALDSLRQAGVEVREANFLYIHAKLMVIDGTSAIIGSQNFTATSLDDNREVAMVITGTILLTRCQAILERDWLRSAPTSGGTVATGTDQAMQRLGQLHALPHSSAQTGSTGVVPFHVTNSIVGPARGGISQALRHAKAKGAHRIDQVELYLREVFRLAPAIGFDPALIVAQSDLETDSWRSDWWIERLNPAGIGITGHPDEEAASPVFVDGTAAARAQLAHMHAEVFGASRPLPPPLQGFDPRYQLVFAAGWAGTVRTVADLSGTWAVDPMYAEKIVLRAREIFP